LFLQTFGSTMIAGGGAGVTGIDAVFEIFVTHNKLVLKVWSDYARIMPGGIVVVKNGCLLTSPPRKKCKAPVGRRFRIILGGMWRRDDVGVFFSQHTE